MLEQELDLMKQKCFWIELAIFHILKQQLYCRARVTPNVSHGQASREATCHGLCWGQMAGGEELEVPFTLLPPLSSLLQMGAAFICSLSAKCKQEWDCLLPCILTQGVV